MIKKNDKKKVIGICSIGSGVGQSVIDSCRLSMLQIKTIGLGNNPLAHGLYQCQDFAYIPSYYSSNYIDELLTVCEAKGIELIIPGHDDEAQVIAQNKDKLSKRGIEAIVSDVELIKICRDKETITHYLPEVSDLFVKSYTLEEAKSLHAQGKLVLPLIAKPRDGYASKGIAIINKTGDFNHVGKSFIIQDIAIPKSSDPHRNIFLKSLEAGNNLQIAEISVQVLCDRDGKITAQCATYNKLNNGVPIEILPFENEEVDKAIDRIATLLVEKGLQGPINIQGRLTDNGFKVFELNPRFTGITGLRASMGFNEVAACIKHWGFGLPLEPLRLNNQVFGIRQTANMALHLNCNAEVETLHKNIHDSKPPKQKPLLLITGSSGTIGRQLISFLASTDDYILWTLDRDKDKTKKIHGLENLTLFDWQDLEKGNVDLGRVDKLIHLASARSFDGPEQITDSLSKSMKIFTSFAAHGAGRIIYSSSQSVYGSDYKDPWKENDGVKPESLYAQAKYVLELHLSTLHQLHPTFLYTVLRIGAVTGNDPKILEHEALAKLTYQAIHENIIDVYGGDQVLGRIDYRDAAEAIALVVKNEGFSVCRTFNVSMKKSYTLREMVNELMQIIQKKKPGKIIKMNVHNSDRAKSYAIDPTLFCESFDWSPKYTLTDIISSLIRD